MTKELNPNNAGNGSQKFDMTRLTPASARHMLNASKKAWGEHYGTNPPSRRPQGEGPCIKVSISLKPGKKGGRGARKRIPLRLKPNGVFHTQSGTKIFEAPTR